VFLVVLDARAEAHRAQHAALDFHAVERAEQGVGFGVFRVQRDCLFERLDGVLHGGIGGAGVGLGVGQALEFEHAVELGRTQPVVGDGGFRVGRGGLAEMPGSGGETVGVPRTVGIGERGDPVMDGTVRWRSSARKGLAAASITMMSVRIIA
jgi:hypothetical protein